MSRLTVIGTRLTIVVVTTVGGFTLLLAQRPTSASEPQVAAPVGPRALQPAGQPTLAEPAAAPGAAIQPTASTPPDTNPPGAASGGVVQATGGTGLTKLGGGTAQQTSSTSYAAYAGRGYSAGRFLLSVEKTPIDFVKKLEGGTVVGVVGVNTSLPGKKQIVNTQVEEITATFGIAGRPILDWVSQSWKAGYQPKNGSIVVGDFNYKAASETDFFNGVITEFTVPTLNGSSKDAVYFTVKIQPETARIQRGDGSDLRNAVGGKLQKAWMASNFRFDLDGLKDPKVASIESFTVRQPVAADKVGATREQAIKATGAVEFPNLKLTISKAAWDPWFGWYNDFLLNRNNDDQHEKNGAIVFLAPNMIDELGRINLFNCGIYRLADQPMEANSEKIARFAAELYCERMELALGKGG